jgi:hypothetical protein
MSRLQNFIDTESRAVNYSGPFKKSEMSRNFYIFIFICMFVGYSLKMAL